MHACSFVLETLYREGHLGLTHNTLAEAALISFYGTEASARHILASIDVFLTLPLFYRIMLGWGRTWELSGVGEAGRAVSGYGSRATRGGGRIVGSGPSF